jgi:hypothetical protein
MRKAVSKLLFLGGDVLYMFGDFLDFLADLLCPQEKI